MSDQSAFSRKTLENATMPPSRGILEELNLPPQAIKFIRANRQNFIIAGVCVVVAASGWSLYNKYVERREQKGASALTLALKEQDAEARAAALARVTDDFGRTSSAIWARYELAHAAYAEGRFDEALKEYETVLGALSGSNPMRPLVLQSLALAQESSGAVDKALVTYGELAAVNGFKGMGLAAVGRLQEAAGNTAKAVEAYESYLNEPQNPAEAERRAMVEERLAILKSAPAQ